MHVSKNKYFLGFKISYLKLIIGSKLYNRLINRIVHIVIEQVFTKILYCIHKTL